KPDWGRIVVDDIVLFDSEKNINLSPQERRMGLMFQNYALFPNMTVLQNIRTGAKREKDKEKREKDVARVMESFGLTDLAGHLPHQLSGGQQQRVALARILVSSPNALLLDEPFSALDSHLRFQLEQEVREVIRDFGKTVLLVSHDRDEVFRMADSIAVMNDGKIEAFGSKKIVFSDPKTKAGAILTGCKNISRLERIDGGVRAVDWGICLPTKDHVNANFLGIRMRDICCGEGENSFRCRVVEEIENPFSFTIMLCPVDAACIVPIGWDIPKDLWYKIKAEEVTIHIPQESVLLLED
ncbi:MAG: ATP-binding cassette domain-containing protein, partial [Firmicutes bacterium]|nr:ATP-binding cassette domain-containing protein [Bacillota bacterium]